MELPTLIINTQLTKDVSFFQFQNFQSNEKNMIVFLSRKFFFMYFYSNNGVFREPIQVTTYESITGHSTILPIAWVEIHPLFDGQEFDLAILGLKSYIQRYYY